MALNDDIRKIPGASYWGTCRKCKDGPTWISTQEDLCMACKFPNIVKREPKEVKKPCRKRRG